MVFVEFKYKMPLRDGRSKCYFVGRSASDVLADVDGGRTFGTIFVSHREITEDEARALQLGFLDVGITDVQKGLCTSFMLSNQH